MNNYKMIEESWTCGDGCCFNSNIYLEKNGKRYTEKYEDNNQIHKRDISFMGITDVVEFLLNVEYSIKIERYMLDWKSETFKNSDYDYLVFDGYSSEGFEDYLYILDRKDYINDLELKTLSPLNIITNFEKKKEEDIYEDLFHKISGTGIEYIYNDLDKD